MKLSNLWGFGKNKRLIEELKAKIEQIELLKKENQEIQKECADKCWGLLKDLSNANTDKVKALKEAEKLTKEIQKLKEKAKEEKRDLKAKIKELEKQLEESMSDKFRVKKVKTGQTPKSQTMKVKPSTKQSKAIKLVKEKY